ncbi:M20/M25/M40 family metallo-hydrolase [Cupriavidus gilardii]|uniref:M20/M25/M40 family metallo-hydrolase n=1 Tax=Cupriavidus gilardii TaxID=82541 RepID=A0A849B671_9BURK|nr:M20/M25/M40 family metallo-hydrolase [Cupriavidus gilardii]QQE09871.1 M20/M25/M40 family metallo-hydrolase [Cupriavidus sp. ISTL7]KAB0595643.1 M20/M25/M40 family metallo-hydrolase [Cupriavidus gilardii]MCT9013455.1 M20/M25/M40 family metallo-hydrolase [Cupriavidus gilardii]MCT9016462.1 M20/M25/M40 family metallo-hydrolase [Cupriavidus gilardii]MCT9056232.1 M20/M25/M40 family metallo-hydrolase [Cupriavidus gilardii]
MQPAVRRLATAVLLVCAAAGTATFAGLAHAAPDATLLEAARAAQPKLIESLKEMVSIESGSRNAAGLAQMAAYAEKRLAALGATTERVKPKSGDSPIVKGTLTGNGKARIMLIAHMDTIYPPNTLATQPIRQDGNKLYGPGIADDKGGIAVILHALEILQARGWRDYARITVLLNADEEIGSDGSGELIAALGEQHDVVLSCEPTAAKAVVKAEALLLGASGTASATMEVKGRAAHAGAAPEHGRNALLELAYQLQQTRDIAKSVPGTQLNWTGAQAGVVRNQIPEVAVATADVRTTVKDGPQQLKAALERKVAESRLIPDTHTTVSMEVGRPPFVVNDKGRALAKRAQQIYAELDGRPLALAEGTGGGTDAGYAALSGKPAVVESFGLAGFGYHARDEYIEIDSIVPRLYLMTRMLQEIGKQ